jgi:hypothetical protein
MLEKQECDDEKRKKKLCKISVFSNFPLGALREIFIKAKL